MILHDPIQVDEFTVDVIQNLDRRRGGAEEKERRAATK
jgi:hypothetical protein